MMMRVRVRPSSSRLTNTVWPRASTTRFFFGAASAGAASRAMAAVTANAVAKIFNRMGSSPGLFVATQSSGLRFAAIERIARNCYAESLRKRPRRCDRAEFSRYEGDPFRCRILRQVFGNRLGVGVVDRRAERLDHLGDLGAPARRIEERRVHRDVGEGMAGLAIGLHLVEAGRFLQLHLLFGGRRGKRDQCGGENNDKCPHGLLPQAVSVMFCMTLL